jgi:hypothetical protein
MGGVELLNPKGLWLLTGLVPLIALYILKIRRTRLKISSTWLWAEARRDLLAKQPFKRLIPELPLILQILALILLSIALARPALRGGKITGDHIAIVVDASASMATKTNAGTTRMQDAIKAGNDVVGAMEPGADAIVIEATRDARVVSPFDRDAKKLKGAIEQVQVREVEGDLGKAVALAADRLRTLGGRKRLIVITDGALATDSPVSAAGIETQIVQVGDPQDNLAIVRLDIRSGRDPSTKHEQAQVFVMVQSFSSKPLATYVTLNIEGRPTPIASRRLTVPPGEKLPVPLTFEPNKMDLGEGLEVHLTTDGDALAVDDVAYGRVPMGAKMPVTLASNSEYSWIARALDADPMVDVQKLSLSQLATVNVDPDALVVVEDACPDATPGADVLIVSPPAGNCMGVDVGDRVEQPQLTSWESGDARLRFLTLDGVHLSAARPLKAPGGSSSLVRAGTITIMADASVPGRSATIVGFDPGDTDWPLKASFVLFVRNIVEQARAHRTQGTTGPVRTGEPLRIAVGRDVTTVTVSGPGIKDQEIAVKGSFAIIPPAMKAGIYRAKWSNPHIGGAVVAANLTSDKESDIRPKPISLEAQVSSSGNLRLADPHKEWGLWLALIAALLVLIDIFWITRTPKQVQVKIAKPGERRHAPGTTEPLDADKARAT